VGERQHATHKLGISVVHERIALLDELEGELVNLVKVVRGVDDLVERDLNHRQVLLDRLLKLSLLLGGVRVVKAENVLALVLVGEEAVEDGGLEVANVEVSRGLGSETDNNLALDGVRELGLNRLGALDLLALVGVRAGLERRVLEVVQDRLGGDLREPAEEVRASGLLDRAGGRRVGCELDKHKHTPKAEASKPQAMRSSLIPRITYSG